MIGFLPFPVLVDICLGLLAVGNYLRVCQVELQRSRDNTKSAQGEAKRKPKMVIEMKTGSRRRAHDMAAGDVRFLSTGPDSGGRQTHTEIIFAGRLPDWDASGAKPGLCSHLGRTVNYLRAGRERLQFA